MMDLDIKIHRGPCKGRGETSKELVVTNWTPEELGQPFLSVLANRRRIVRDQQDSLDHAPSLSRQL